MFTSSFLIIVSKLILFLFHLTSVLWCCWFGSRKGIRPVKTELCDVGVVICLWWGADLHMAQLMPLPLTISCSSKSRLVLPSWFYLSGTCWPGWTRTYSWPAVKRLCVCVFQVLPFWYRLTRVVPDKRPLNWCNSSSSTRQEQNVSKLSYFVSRGTCGPNSVSHGGPTDDLYYRLLVFPQDLMIWGVDRISHACLFRYLVLVC